MARDMIEANTSFFGHVEQHAQRHGYGLTFKKLCIKTTNDEKQVLKHAKVLLPIKSYWGSVFGIAYADSLIIALVDVPESQEIDVEPLEEMGLHAGYYTLVGASVDLFNVEVEQFGKAYDLLLNDMENHELDIGGVRHIPADVCHEFTRPVRLFMSQDWQELSENEVNRLAACIFSKCVNNNDDERRNFHEAVAGLCVNGRKVIPYDCVLNSVTSLGWKHTFLELYRCIEYLYGIPESKELANKFSEKTYASDLLVELRGVIGWKPFELGALTRLMKDISLDAVERLGLALGCDEPDKPDVVSKSLYSLRNSVVHFRSGQEVKKLHEMNWGRICVELCEVIHLCYVAFESEINTETDEDEQDSPDKGREVDVAEEGGVE
ncbi:hypothetical protein [Halomonas nitroreducens]|uniref:Apea-like HEPN domain-containing protein n=1 Tax=Halomonas nitroreducens TaxID=447425 RepID=A0A3S0JZX2_9GAMM|nr:hypothetical protein [Halomonas nitroreducens]RTQ97197.1 hypothetical protein EKG36_20300 [Halomonas nitroreducens]